MTGPIAVHSIRWWTTLPILESDSKTRCDNVIVDPWKKDTKRRWPIFMVRNKRAESEIKDNSSDERDNEAKEKTAILREWKFNRSVDRVIRSLIAPSVGWLAGSWNARGSNLGGDNLKKPSPYSTSSYESELPIAQTGAKGAAGSCT